MKTIIVKYIFVFLFGVGVAILFTSCATTQGIERRAEIRQARYEAKIARIKADTLSIQRTDNTYRQTGWNLWWNDPFYLNRWGWNNQIYRPQIVIPLKKRKRNGRNNTTGYRGFNRPTKPVQIKPRNNGNNTRNINSVRGGNRSGNSVSRQPIRQKVKPQLPTRLRQGNTGGRRNKQ